jgi:hypothetical protein
VIMLGSLVQEFIDSNFLAREASELGRVNSQLKGAVALNRATLADLTEHLAAGESQLAALSSQRESLLAEVQRLDGDRMVAQREAAAARATATAAERAKIETAAKLTQAKAQLVALRDEYSREQSEWKAIALADVDRATAAARATTAETLATLEAEIQNHTTTAARLAAEAADKATSLDGINAELNRVNIALSAAETRFSEKHTDLIAAYQVATDEHAAKLATLAGATAEQVKALEAEIQQRQNRIVELEAQFAELKAQIIAEAQEHIDLARRQFEVEQAAALNQLEAERIAVHKDLTMSQEALIEKYRPMIEAPLLEELRQTQIEVGRVHKKLAEKAGDSLVWNPDQIREFLLDVDADGDSPSHLRICGATKSGKSFLVNQIIAGGLKSLGFDADFTVIDPYHSQTKWAVAPTVKDDSKAAYELILQWAAACDGKPLERPAVLVVDELDSLIADYGEPLSEAIKKLIKKGRHFNRYFYWLGQNGNCPKKMQWSDVKNFNQIYLGTVADDYCENGLRARQKNRWLGELEALRDKSKYHAIVHAKGCNPYTRLLPRSYFASETTTAASETGATAAEPVLKCPKCGSANTKKAGALNGRQRVKCHDCGKQSYAE